MRLAPYALFFAGVVLLGWSAFLDPYSNHKQYPDIPEAETPYYGDSGIQGDTSAVSQAYSKERGRQLTAKFQLEDYGWTLLILAVVAGVARARGLHFGALKSMKTPSRPLKVFLLSTLAAALSTAACTASLFIDFGRQAFPPWADSLGIPLMGIPFTFIALLLVACLLWFLGNPGYQAGVPVFAILQMKRLPHPVWCVLLGLPLLISAALTLFSLATGDFLFIVPECIWLTSLLFYFSSKQKVRALNNRLPRRL